LQPDEFKPIVLNRPSEEVAIIIEWYIDENPEATVIQDDTIVEIARRRGYRNNYKADTLASYIFKEGNSYFEALLDAKDKDIVDTEEYETIIKTRLAIQKSCYFLMLPERKTEELVEFDLFGMPCKGYIDYRITEGNKFTIKELKITGKNALKYKYDFKSRKVYMQIALYEHAICQLYGLDPSDHYVVVAENKDYHQVLQYRIERNYIEKGYEDLQMLVDRIKYHEENGYKSHLEERHGLVLSLDDDTTEEILIEEPEEF
jgi:hypothetical protein